MRSWCFEFEPVIWENKTSSFVTSSQFYPYIDLKISSSNNNYVFKRRPRKFGGQPMPHEWHFGNMNTVDPDVGGKLRRSKCWCWRIRWLDMGVPFLWCWRVGSPGHLWGFNKHQECHAPTCRVSGGWSSYRVFADAWGPSSKAHHIYIYIYMASVWLSGESNNLVHIWSDLVVANLHSNNSPFMCASQLCATQCLWREWCLCTTNRHYISYLHSPYPFPQFLIPCQPCLPCFLTLLSFNCTKYSYLITNSKCLA